MKTVRVPTPLLIVFLDFSFFAKESERFGDEATADVLSAYYERVADSVHSRGGTTVKFMGDGALLVFPETAIDSAVRLMLELKTNLDALMSMRGWKCRLEVKVHFGEVIADHFGPPGVRRWDVIGHEVNRTVALKGDGVTLSPEAYDRLPLPLRTKFTARADARGGQVWVA